VPGASGTMSRVTIQVLVVCTGNVCRSPVAERLLAAALPSDAVQVASAGIRAVAGHPIDEPMAELLRAAGGDPDGFAARQLEAEELRAADLVLVMAREHRAAVASLVPARVRTTLLLREAALAASAVQEAGWPADLDLDPAARLAALPRLAGRLRRPTGRTDLEVPDPYRRSPEVYQESFDQVASAVAELAAALALRA